tara:strand:+ start:490 stop:891 length:402 start_codon:yes stop_codon:yes gene_type:complete
MPVERISKGFKDISMSFQVNPINSDTIAVKNDTAIARSIRNLVLTNPGERFFNPTLGSRISEILFDNADDISAAALREEIEETINVYESRVKLQNVKVKPDFERHSFDITITYDIVGIDALPQQLNFALQSTR